VDILENIIKVRKARLAEAKNSAPLEAVRAQALAVRSRATPHRLREALLRDTAVNIIAEIKRASPSKGLIRDGVVPADLARSYEAASAAAVSVLTEHDHFQGSLADLSSVRAAVSVPLLRKDFVVEEYQVYESAAAGADAILLIVAALDEVGLAALRRLAEEELGLDVLVEVHTVRELRRALDCGARTIGINNRDLRTLKVSLQTSIELAEDVPDDILRISESGIESGDDIRRLRLCGYRGFLVGEALMRAPDPGRALAELIKSSV
jgi:indole-3-glycerol phosphate synthase